MLVPSFAIRILFAGDRSPSNRNAAEKESPEPWKEVVLAVARAPPVAPLLSPVSCSDLLRP